MRTGLQLLINLLEDLHFLHPAILHEADVVGMLVIGVVCRLIGKLHQEAPDIVILWADFPEAFKVLNAGNCRKGNACIEEILLLSRPDGMDGLEDYGMTNSSSTHKGDKVMG